MLSDFLKKNIQSQAEFIQTNGYGYGQVEPNHLSAQRTAQVYAQLPADPAIDVLEQGQFVKYDYAKGLVDFTGEGELMLVFNEIKLYRDHQLDCEFAMIKDNYQARVYSPLAADTTWTKQARYLNGTNAQGALYEDVPTTLYAELDKNGNGVVTINSEDFVVTNKSATYKRPTVTVDASTGKKTYGTEDVSISFDDTGASTQKVSVRYLYDDVTAAPDMYEITYNEDPFHFEGNYHEKMMPAGTTMVPRVFKTNVGDIFTTNTIGETSVKVGDVLTPRAADGILAKGNGDMKWQVVKVYTMPDHQPGVKVMRIA